MVNTSYHNAAIPSLVSLTEWVLVVRRWYACIIMKSSCVVSTAPPHLGEGLEIRKHLRIALYHPFLEKDPVFHCWWSFGFTAPVSTILFLSLCLQIHVI